MNPSITPPDADSVTALPKKANTLFVLGIVVYCGVIWYLGWQNIHERLLEAEVVPLLIATILIFVATWMRVAKWRYGLGARQDATGLYFLSKATGNITPGRLGEFAPMALRQHRTPRVGAWIMFDRVIEILVTLGLGLSGLALIDLLAPWQFTGILITTLLGCAFGLYLLSHRRLFLWIAQAFNPEGFLHKTILLCAAISTELRQFLHTLPGVLGITLLTKVMDLYAIVLIFRALATSPGLALIAAAKCALAIVSFIPFTPTATGVPHGTQAWLMHEVSAMPYEAIALGIGLEIAIVSITFWTSFGLAGRFIKRATVGR